MAESESDDSSDSDDSSSDSDSSSSEDDTPTKATPKVAPVKAKVPKPAVVTPKPAVATPVAAKASDRSALHILTQPRRLMTSDAIDELVPLILRHDRPSNVAGDSGKDDGKVAVISSINLQAVLSRFKRGVDPVTSENVYKLLGTTREQIDHADAVVVFLHGPHTETERMARLKYEGAETENFHWSLICWFRADEHEALHYDSHFPLNDARCNEALGMLRALGVFPKTMRNYVMPDYFPQQEEGWECGYDALIALTIISSRTVPSPIADLDVKGSFHSFFSTLGEGGQNAYFMKRMRELLAREKYAF